MTIDQARNRKALARWHRRVAVFVGLWLAVLAVSGILINHAHDWRLDSKPLNPLLQRWVYGIEATGEDFCDAVPSIGMECTGIFARLPLPAGALLLAEHSLFLLDDSGQMVEKLIAGQLGLAALHAGLIEGPRIYLRDEHKVVRTDADLMSREILDQRDAEALRGLDWQVRIETADAITWERLLLDLHAARFLGPLAKLFNDLLAGLILLLAVSGAWLFRLKRNGNGNGNGTSKS